MAKKVFILHDSFKLKISKNKSKELKDSLEDGKALIVKIKATHGGYTNGNFFYYDVDSMNIATKTWLKPFPKPVLIHHHDEKDAIGRVIDAEFVSMSTNRKNKPKGNILLTLRITDQDAIEKILDGRYMTVSVSSAPNSAICTICDRDLIEDGPCNHVRGKKYDDKLCYWNVDVKEYTEVSFVNKPADEYQQGIESTQFSDLEENDFNFSIDINKAEFQLEDINKEENIIEIEKQIPTIEEVDGTWTQDDLDMIQWLIDKMSEEFKDAKLSTAQRKKLSSKVFCGPNKSFPVNDCAHYTAAKKLIGKYKGSGDKSRILACIERRGRTLNCSTAKNKTKDSYGDKNMEEKIKELETQITDLKKEVENNQKDYNIIKDEKQTLENQLTEKSEEIEQLNDKIIKFEANKHTRLVDELYSLKVKLDKNDVKDFSSDEEIKAYKEILSKRTSESLFDSISDMKSEIKEKTEPNEPTKKITKDSVDKKEKNTELKNESETEIKDLGDDLNKGE